MYFRVIWLLLDDHYGEDHFVGPCDFYRCTRERQLKPIRTPHDEYASLALLDCPTKGLYGFHEEMREHQEAAKLPKKGGKNTYDRRTAQ
jgi:hypothetical protein